MCDANAMLCASFIPFDASLYYSFIGLGRVHPATKGWLRHGGSITPSLRSPLAPPAPFQHRLLPLPSAVRHGPSSLPANEICFHSSTFFLSFCHPREDWGVWAVWVGSHFLINTRESNNVIQRMPRRHRVSRLPESKEAGRVGWGEGEGRHGEFIHPGSGDLVSLDPIMTR